MSDNSTIGKLETLDPGLFQSAATAKRNTKEIGKQEFLTMLVTQLKNQDPLDPISNDRFAVDLAQFSQLEQLMDMNKKLENGSGDSLAAYLGREVVLNKSQLEVAGGDGGSISFDLARDAESVVIELLDGSGNTITALNAGALNRGRTNVALNDLGVSDGEYSLRITARDSAGGISYPEPCFGGIVSGFVPGDEPLLIVNGREVNPADIKEVRVVEESTVQEE